MMVGITATEKMSARQNDTSYYFAAKRAKGGNHIKTDLNGNKKKIF